MAQWLTLMLRNREAAGSNLSGVLAFLSKALIMKLAIVEKKTFLAGLQCTLTSSCAINISIVSEEWLFPMGALNEFHS